MHEPRNGPSKTKAVITKDQMDQIKAIVGADAVFIAVMDKGDMTCTEAICKGHYAFARQSGWPEEQLNGILWSMNEGRQHIHSDECGDIKVED